MPPVSSQPVTYLSPGEKEWTLYASADILYWVAANVPVHSHPLYWTQAQKDECVRLVENLRAMERELQSRRRAGRKKTSRGCGPSRRSAPEPSSQ